METERTILHVDMNSFFGTVEQQANPALRGKPVGIIKAKDRGCVIAASIEAKRYGVKTGTTVWEAKKLCPQIILVPSDMDKYFSVTKGLTRIISDYSPDMEVFSIDECFIDITNTQHLFAGGAWEIAMLIKQRIREELGDWLKCSIGISFTKLLAKLGSELQKPDGLTFLNRQNYLSVTHDVAVGEVCGIGWARAAYLHKRSAYTLGQARLLTDLPSDIDDLVWLRLDQPLSPIQDLEPAKSVSRTFTTFKLVEDQKQIRDLARNLLEEACVKLRDMKMAGRTFSLRLDDFWARKTIAAPTADPLIIFDILWREYLQRPIPAVRFAGVHISNLAFDGQCELFPRRRALLDATDLVNKRFGVFTLYPAQLMGGLLIRPEVTGYLGDKYYQLTLQR